ncbi:MAG: DUF4388 domain-containing protein, partial [Deltaproteobacteria bacterium]|nr:DUF4388 domain-containing protein [Deltaproteobacteria bacterium]
MTSWARAVDCRRRKPQSAVAKKSLLLVDADSQSLRMLEVSLRKAGFSVTTAVDAIDAWDKLRHALPDLIVADTKLPGPVSGFEFVADLKRVGDTSTIPVIFLASNATLAEKIIGLELGVDDYLTKPIYLKEVLTRVRVLLDKRDQQRLEGRERSTPPFSGLLGDMGLVDLVQTIELGRKTGRLVIHAGRDRGVIAFRDGRIVNARCGRLVGERAFYRMLVWSEGSFAMTFEAHREPEVIAHSTQMLLMEGVRRVDEWGRLAEQLPPVGHVFEIDFTAFGESLAQIPDEVNALLRHFDGRRSLLQVIDETELGDLEALEFASKLFFEGLIVDRTPVGEEPAAEPEPWPEEFNDGAAAAGGGLLVPHDTMPPGPAPAAASLPRLEDILAPPEGAAGAEVGAPARGDSPPPDLAAPTLALSPPMSSASPGQPSAGSPPPAARDHAALAMPVPLSLPASLSPQSMPPVPPLVATTPPLASAPSGSLSSPAALSS